MYAETISLKRIVVSDIHVTAVWPVCSRPGERTHNSINRCRFICVSTGDSSHIFALAHSRIGGLVLVFELQIVHEVNII